MRNFALVIDSSWLTQNICRAILSREMISECAMYIDDIDIFVSRQMPAVLIIGDSSYDNDKWGRLEARLPKIRSLKKIFIAENEAVPAGFELLKRPFAPDELLFKLCDIFGAKGQKYRISPDAGNVASDRRIFKRSAVETTVYFDDEFGRPLLRLAMKDISLGGIFVSGNVPVKIGSMVFLSFSLKEKKLSVTGQVVRVTDGGLGIRFMGLSEDARRCIESHCY